MFEFRLWAALTEQSRGSLHVFLPLADRGVDALVHRMTDGAYIPIQAKGRSTLVGGEVHLVVWADSLQNDEALLVGGLITEGGLGPTLLVVREVDFKFLADHSQWDGRPIYSMGFGMSPRSDSRWLRYLTPADRLAECFGISPPAVAPEAAVEARPTWRSDLGFLGESELVRLLAEDGDLNLFRPFPDLETSELAVLHLRTHHVIGLQVKTGGVDAGHPAARITIRASSFQPSASTYFVVLAWLREENRFHEECLLVPSEEVRGVCQPGEAEDQWQFEWHPGSSRQRHLSPYRVPTQALRTEVARRLTS